MYSLLVFTLAVFNIAQAFPNPAPLGSRHEPPGPGDGNSVHIVTPSAFPGVASNYGGGYVGGAEPYIRDTRKIPAIDQVNYKKLTRDELCHRGFLVGIKDAFNNGLVNGANAIQQLGEKIGLGNLINGVGDGFRTLTRGANEDLDDAGCGLGDIGESAASKLNKGDLFGGIKSVIARFIQGLVGSIGGNTLHKVGETAKNLFGGLRSANKGNLKKSIGLSMNKP